MGEIAMGYEKPREFINLVEELDGLTEENEIKQVINEYSGLGYFSSKEKYNKIVKDILDFNCSFWGIKKNIKLEKSYLAPDGIEQFIEELKNLVDFNKKRTDGIINNIYY